jgi:deoxyribodipyrimidine photo-lyase
LGAFRKDAVAKYREISSTLHLYFVAKLTPVLLWFRNDLRLNDNPALQAALKSGRRVIPIFIWAPEEESPWQPGAASRWWLNRSLTALEKSLKDRGSRLVVGTGDSAKILINLARETQSEAVYWNKRYEPVIRSRDERIAQELRAAGVQVFSFNGSLLFEPDAIRNKSGKPFQVFTPFWKHCLAQGEPGEPVQAPKTIPSPARWPKSIPIDSLGLAPVPNWAGGLASAWTPGEQGALRQVAEFCDSGFSGYGQGRNALSEKQTSRLSPHLHFGEISPGRIWHSTKKEAHRRGTKPAEWRHSTFLAELGWREFSHHLLYHFPSSDQEPLRTNFAGFRWRDDPEGLRRWQRGQTGFPVVDAGMRELWATGWMHNRARMITASFLVKDLLIPWQMGARWFWDTLVDADLAQNTLGWQWSAGTGADASPFFRIFNPTTQGEKFDPEGAYVRRWVPELAAMPARWIHKPHQAPEDVLKKAGLIPGESYPDPMLNHSMARTRALERYGERLKTPVIR